MNPADSGERYPGTLTRAVARAALTVYGISLALIALWPGPVDANAGPLLRAVNRVFPVLTYARIEFSANIVLFVPLGVLLMLIMRRRYLILPIALVVTVAIECSQALMLDKRTPSMLDIVANTAGACIGMLIVALADGRRVRASRDGADPQARDDAEKWVALGFELPPLPPAPSVVRPPGVPLPSMAHVARVPIAAEAASVLQDRIPPRPPAPLPVPPAPIHSPRANAPTASVPTYN